MHYYYLNLDLPILPTTYYNYDFIESANIIVSISGKSIPTALYL